MDANFPILEFDPERAAIVEPSHVAEPRDVPEHCVICFFKEVIEEVADESKAGVVADNRWADGPHPLYEIAYSGRRLAFYHPGVGSGMAAALLEEVISLGCRKFIACGGCGVLERDMPVGKLIVLSAAVRDEGVSYHYLPPGREIKANEQVVAALEKTLSRQGVPYRPGRSMLHIAKHVRRSPSEEAKDV